jgi:hypothetical protein
MPEQPRNSIPGATVTDQKLTYTPAEASAMFPCNERWLIKQLRSGRFPGRKIAREWRMTREDIEQSIEICSAGRQVPQPISVDIVAPESRRRTKWKAQQ